MDIVFRGIEGACERLDDALRSATTEVGNEEEESGLLHNGHISPRCSSYEED